MKKIKSLSLTNKIIKKLKKEGKVTYSNGFEHNKKYYDEMKKIIDDTKRKQRTSSIIARNTYLD